MDVVSGNTQFQQKVIYACVEPRYWIVLVAGLDGYLLNGMCVFFVCDHFHKGLINTWGYKKKR